MSQNPNIIIVGGGPVGATLALLLQAKGIAVAMLEARDKGASHQDQRALALSYGSRLVLERLGIWAALMPQATAINTIHISERGSFGRARMQAKDYGQEALGYVLAYGTLCKALDGALDRFNQAKVIYGAEVIAIQPSRDSASVTFSQMDKEHTLQGSMAVLADGGRSLGDIPGLNRETKEYGHDALVTKVVCELPHDNIAYERFTSAGPVALLPNGVRDFSLVWTGKQEAVQKLLKLKDDAFLASLHAHFGDRVGRFLSVGKRLSFPLRLSYLSSATAPHLVVIGNAAQTMHPVAGQGFNVGLRDAWELASAITAAEPSAWGSKTMLETYLKSRKADTRHGLLFTDFLVETFSNDIVGLSKLRGVCLGMLDIIGPVKKRLVSKMSFGANG